MGVGNFTLRELGDREQQLRLWPDQHCDWFSKFQMAVPPECIM